MWVIVRGFQFSHSKNGMDIFRESASLSLVVSVGKII